jgi:hypothetical protein
MKTETKEENQAVNYLLGELKEAEQEKIEKRFFTDAEYSDFLEDVEADLIDGYVRGELSDAQKKSFENKFLITERRREKVQIARTLYDYEKNKQPKVVPLVETERISFWDSVRAFFALPNPSFAYGFAALALVFLLGGLWLYVQNRNLRNDVARLEQERQSETQNIEELRRKTKEIEQQADNERGKNEELNEQLKLEKEKLAQAESRKENLEREIEELKRKNTDGSQGGGITSAIASFVLPPTVRDQAPTQIAVPKTAKTVRLQLQLEDGNNYPSYKAELRNAGGNLLFNSTIRRKSLRGITFLNVNVPARLLNEGGYELTLKGITQEGQSEDIAFYDFIVKKR